MRQPPSFYERNQTIPLTHQTMASTPRVDVPGDFENEEPVTKGPQLRHKVTYRQPHRPRFQILKISAKAANCALVESQALFLRPNRTNVTVSHYSCSPFPLSLQTSVIFPFLFFPLIHSSSSLSAKVWLTLLVSALSCLWFSFLFLFPFLLVVQAQ